MADDVFLPFWIGGGIVSACGAALVLLRMGRGRDAPPVARGPCPRCGAPLFRDGTCRRCPAAVGGAPPYRASAATAPAAVKARERCRRCALVQAAQGIACSRCGAPLLVGQGEPHAAEHPAIAEIEHATTLTAIAGLAFYGSMIGFALLFATIAITRSGGAAASAAAVLFGVPTVVYRLTRLTRWRGGERAVDGRRPLLSSVRRRVAAGTAKGTMDVTASLLVATPDALVAVPFPFTRGFCAHLAAIALLARNHEERQRALLDELDDRSDAQIASMGRAFRVSELQAIELEGSGRGLLRVVTASGAKHVLRFFTADDFVRACAALAAQYPALVSIT